MKLHQLFKIISVVTLLAIVVMGCSSDKSQARPTKDELVTHLVQLAKSQDGLGDLVPEETLNEVYSCLVGEIYDEMSTETLIGIKEVKEFDSTSEYPFDFKGEEKEVFNRATGTCEEKFRDDPSLNPNLNTQETTPAQ